MNERENLYRKEREREFHNREFGDSARSGADKFYAVTRLSFRHYLSLVRDGCAGKRILEYGCGPDGAAFDLARLGAKVTGIDISDVAIARAQETADRQGLTTADFRRMDAERMEFPDGSFDLIIGTGILHHLNLGDALPEISRTLRQHGRAVFLEPLGHNPLIRFYRWLTPQMRSADEHPLLIGDFRQMHKHFGRVDLYPYHLSSLAAVPFRGTRAFERVLGALEAIDGAVFRMLPIARRYAWMTLVVLSDPLAGRPTQGARPYG